MEEWKVGSVRAYFIGRQKGHPNGDPASLARPEHKSLFNSHLLHNLVIMKPLIFLTVCHGKGRVKGHESLTCKFIIAVSQ